MNKKKIDEILNIKSTWITTMNCFKSQSFGSALRFKIGHLHSQGIKLDQI